MNRGVLLGLVLLGLLFVGTGLATAGCHPNCANIDPDFSTSAAWAEEIVDGLDLDPPAIDLM